jgi:hypothetical protein
VTVDRWVGLLQDGMFLQAQLLLGERRHVAWLWCAVLHSLCLGRLTSADDMMPACRCLLCCVCAGSVRGRSFGRMHGLRTILLVCQQVKRTLLCYLSCGLMNSASRRV